ncbi:DUF2804 domain-containing protein [Streptomyces sp. NPDC002790]|uniref:DUF2804 domain-containing protein n=1 Tax=Streptomyces sp. NPDC002790 TaxID=3154431 RepID=UPI0033334E2C
MHTGHRVAEREITERTNLCRPDGRLNPDAVGWSRTPLHHTNLKGWGRTMRWEYWCVVTPNHVFAVTASSLDYLSSKGAWCLDRRTNTPLHSVEVTKPARGVQFPDRCGEGSVWLGPGQNSVSIEEVPGHTRLRVKAGELRADLRVERVPGRDSLAVVVPWSDRRFQYTVKDVGRPVEGTITVRGEEFPVSAEESVATLDHGRGRWPSSTLWNWGAAHGHVDGREVGLQIGGKWTDGTGSVENGLFLDGRLHKISEELVWRYDSQDWYAPWHITGERVDLEFQPEYVRSSDATRLWMRSREDQAFGRYRGRVVDDAGETVEVRDLYGWAEEVHRRW